jgi:hypothetical protein
MSKKGRRLLLAGVLTMTVVASLAILLPALSSVTSAKPELKTSWGEPDLQGIWTREVDIPLERPAKYANQEFFSDAERKDLDQQISDIIKRDSTEERRARGTERDVNSEFTQEPFTMHLPVGRRTSLIVDPPDGRIPRLTPEAQKARNAFRQFQLALLQPTESCRDHHPGCAGGKYGPVSPRRNETPPSYIGSNANAGINRADGPEDRTLTERCVNGTLPDFGNFIGGFSRIVQSAGVMSILYDVGPGVGRPRVIPITTAPHLPATMRQYWGDSRGTGRATRSWSTSRTSRRSRISRALTKTCIWWNDGRASMRTRSTTSSRSTIPTTWVRSWTVRQELKKQSDAANRIYYEPRCHEGNYGLIALLSGARESERAFAERRGPDPATMCIVIGGCGGFVRGGFADTGADADPFQTPPPRAP